MRIINLTASIILLIAALILGTRIISFSKETQKLKADYAEINHFKYGIFSVNEWKKRVTFIIAEEIDQLSLSKEDEKIVRKQLRAQLNILIDKVLIQIKKATYDSPGGQIKYGIFKTLVDPQDIKEGLPEYTNAILKELKRSKNQFQLKAMLKKKIRTYMEKTFDVFDDSKRIAIMKETGTTSTEEAKIKLHQMIKDNEVSINTEAVLLLSIAVLVFLLGRVKFIFPVLVILLITGITTPMIDLEAQIELFKFNLFEHEVLFENQILYFQSKSIQDVFMIMMRHKEIQMKFVGFLMISFCMIIPAFKLISSLFYYLGNRNKFVRFFVLKSGKWSMADVLVVAIFMAYIGFDAIVDNQLEKLKAAGQELNIVTTNGTQLQPGFYLFLAYTILAMLVPKFLERTNHHESKHPVAQYEKQDWSAVIKRMMDAVRLMILMPFACYQKNQHPSWGQAKTSVFTSTNKVGQIQMFLRKLILWMRG